MWTKADSWGSAGFRYGLSLIRGMCRSLTEGEQHKVATCIVERLESTNWKDRTGPGARGDMSRAGRGPNLKSR